MLWIVALGGCLEFYDFAVFLFFAGVLNEVFFPEGSSSWLLTLQLWGLFAAGYVFRPFGGLVLAHFGDIFGRKRVFSVSILLMAASTFGIALLPTYAMVGVGASVSLLILRAAQGIAIGGEVPGAWVFAAEHMTRQNRGLACGAICGGLALGILLASLTASAVMSVLSAEAVLQYGWRIPFLLGGLFGFLSLRLRRLLLETPAFARSQANTPLVVELPVRSVIETQKLALCLSIVATWILSASVVVSALLLPRMLHDLYGYTHETALIGSCVSTVVLAVGLVVAGWLLDRIGLAAFFMIFGVLLATSMLAFFEMRGADAMHYYILCGVIGISGTISAGAPYLMVSAFPVSVRYTGVSFAYNLAYAIFGGLTPVFITGISFLAEPAHVIYLAGMGAIALFLGAYLFIRPLPDIPD
jgi:predicted MFS family arabinose efflux permease